MEKVTTDYNTDELLAIVEDLPVRIFGDREFYTFNHAMSATVSDNYPENMTVIEIEDHEGNTIELLYSDTKDYGFKEPVFIG